MKNFKKEGFTLIELLVVIVIIGILSSIGVSTFQGYFVKAKNARLIHSVGVYKKGLQLYFAENGNYPVLGPSTGRSYHCLGEYPLSDYEVEGQCWKRDVYESYTKNDIINQTISTSTGVLPSASEYIKTATGKIRGVIFGRDPSDYMATGEKAYYSISYFLEGLDQDCQHTVHTYVSGDLVRAERNTSSNTANTLEITACTMILPQPSGEQ